MLIKFFSTCALLVFSFSCSSKNQGPDSPTKILQEYVSQGFAVRSVGDKEKLVLFTTGEVRKVLTELPNESFKERFVNAKRQFVSLKVKDERSVHDDQYSVTYELTYSTPESDRVTVKKHALFEKKEGKWLIAEVRNLKTFIEHKNEISF